MNIYAVVGTTGEYGDKSEWTVASYASKQAALQHVYNANEWLLSKGVHQESPAPGFLDWAERQTLKSHNPWDTDMGLDYTGTRYYLVPLLFHPSARSAVKPRAA